MTKNHATHQNNECTSHKKKDAELAQPFNMSIYKILTKKTEAGYISMMSQRFKNSREAASEGPTVLYTHFCSLLTYPRHDYKFHARLYGRFIEIKSNLRKKKLHRTNQGSNLPGDSFSSSENVTNPIQFRRKQQPKHLKRLLHK